MSKALNTEKKKAKPAKTISIRYGLVHPLIGKNVRFDSWETLCEYVLDTAEEEAKRQLQVQLMELICVLSDEIIETAVECEEDSTHGFKANN